jgi:hypothetical protein
MGNHDVVTTDYLMLASSLLEAAGFFLFLPVYW